MQTMNATPLNELELEFLDATLSKYADDESIFCLPMLDGYLTAIVSAPNMIMPSVYIQNIFPEDMQWEDEQEAQKFFGLVMRLYNEIIANANSELGVSCIFDVGEKDGQECLDLAIWCAGYIFGVELDEQWEEVLDEEGLENLEFIRDFADIELLYKATEEQADAVTVAINMLYRHIFQFRTKNINQQKIVKRPASPAVKRKKRVKPAANKVKKPKRK